MSGITPLLQTLQELEEKNIEGQILTTNYLNFSEPWALVKYKKGEMKARALFMQCLYGLALSIFYGAVHMCVKCTKIGYKNIQ